MVSRPEPHAEPTDRGRHLVLTGAPGGGKTTVLERLAPLGYRIVGDAARTLIGERQRAGLPPRPAPAAFARMLLDQALADLDPPGPAGTTTLHDRGLPDALLLALDAGLMDLPEARRVLAASAVDRRVFLFGAWAEIHRTDAQRDQDLDAARKVEGSFRALLPQLGMTIIEVPRGSVAERVAFLLDAFGHGGS